MMGIINTYVENVQSVGGLKWVIGILVYLAGAIIAINVWMGRNSLFMLKQAEYAFGSVGGPVVFFLGWLFWYIGYPLLYIVLVVGAWREDPDEFKKLFAKIGNTLLRGFAWLSAIFCLLLSYVTIFGV